MLLPRMLLRPGIRSSGGKLLCEDLAGLNGVAARRFLIGLFVLLALSLPAYATASAKLTIKVISITSPASPGSDARLVIATLPGTDCGITVVYKSGPSRAQGLVPKKADGRGRVAWVWRVGTRTTAGTWPIFVECTLGNQRAEVKVAFTVR